MSVNTYSAQARDILGAGTQEERWEARRDIAREALARGKYEPVEIDGRTIWIAAQPEHTAFARVTLASGRVIAVNPRRVVQVHSEQTHGGAELTILVTTSGDPLPCAGSVEDVVAQLEAVA